MSFSFERGTGGVVVLLLVVTACGGTTFDQVSGEGTGGGSSGGASAGGSSAGGASNGGSSAGGVTGAGGSAAGGRGTGGFGTGGFGTGGTGSTFLWAHDYDQSCTFDDDCFVVTEGDQCGCLGCQNAAVSQRSKAEWNAHLTAILCPGPPPPCPLIDCAAMVPACSNGTCVARIPIYIDPNQYDRSCTANSDCRLIYTGDVCSTCRCATSAVNQKGYDQYLADTANQSCNPGPSPCDCLPQTNVACAMDTGAIGTCVVGF